MKLPLISPCLILLCSGLAAETVQRGPYLQTTTPVSVAVCWRTDVSAPGQIRYGTDAGKLDLRVEAAAAIDHEVVLTGLTPDTAYTYQVINAAGANLGTPATFRTHPQPGAQRKIRLWALGDAGTQNKNQIAVRDAFYAWNKGPTCDAVLLLGDNAYADGTDEQYQKAIFDIYPDSLRSVTFWSCIGNHDMHLLRSGMKVEATPYMQMFRMPVAGESGGTPSGSERYYSVDLADVHLVCLDTQTSDVSSNGPMATWLKADLAATTKRWVIAFFHHPPYSKGSHDSDKEKQLGVIRMNLVPILDQYGVDLTLTGHSHSYERSILVDGHYGTSDTLTAEMKKDAGNGREDGTGAYQKASGPHQGTVHAVAGSAGKISGGALNHPIMAISLNQLGSLAIDIQPGRLDAWFIRDDTTIGDTFTILKPVR